MKINSPLCLSVLFLSTFPLQSFAKATDYAEFNVATPAPEVNVTAKGQTFDKATANGPLKFNGLARGKCAWGYRYTFVSATLDQDNSNGGLPGVAGNKIFTDGGNKARTWSENFKPIEVSMNMDSRIRKQAVKACNDELDKRVQQGYNKLNTIHNGFSTEITPYYMGFHFHCSDYGLGYFQNHKYQKAPIKVNCGAGSDTTPKPKPAVPTAGGIKQFSKALQLTMVDIKASPDNYKGPCPKDITFTGYIHTNGADGEVQYRFIKEGNPLGGFKKLQFNQGKKVAQVTYTMQAKPPRAKGKQGANQLGFAAQGPQPVNNLQIKKAPKMEIEVKTSKQNLKDEAAYNYTCQAPKKAKLIPVNKSVDIDLTSQVGMQIGQQSAPWGGLINVSAKDASQKGPRGCQFRIAYDVVNKGDENASGFQNLVKDGMKTIHSNNNFAVSANSSKKVSGLINLKPGSYTLNASIDSAKQVEETNESNNLFRIRVNVAEDCGPGNGKPPRLVPAKARPTTSTLPQ